MPKTFQKLKMKKESAMTDVLNVLVVNMVPVKNQLTKKQGAVSVMLEDFQN